jgi:hypothetical protein
MDRAGDITYQVGLTIADLAGTKKSNPPTSPRRFNIEPWTED